MDWLSLISIDQLGDAAKSEFAQNIVVFGIMWSVIKKTVHAHFSNIEDSLKKIAAGLENLKESHDARLAKIEDEIKELKQGG